MITRDSKNIVFPGMQLGVGKSAVMAWKDAANTAIREDVK